ncbi:mediator complex subunit 13 C-terminal-domain-containing protein [Xylariales sp. PMI_506]|nr:mediator complex subunit 13 C-terminal-domain-containing protein [Xylariales sp. PMI_506]
MDTAEYETNALVINNISSVAYAFYEVLSPPLDFHGPGALELEGALRNDGYLVYIDPTRRGLWCFALNKKDSEQKPSSFLKSLDVCGYSLAVVEEAAFEPASLAKSRGYGPNTANTPNSSSSNGSNPLDVVSKPPSMVGDQDIKALVAIDAKPVSTTVKEVYEHLISAVLSALSSAFCVTTGSTPLNSRTLLIPQQLEGEAGQPVPILASFRAYLTTTGVLVTLISLSQVEGLMTISDSSLLPPLGITVLAAPIGVFATCQAIADTEHASTHSAMAQSPDTQISRIRPEKEIAPWRTVCAKLLQARNMPPPPAGGSHKWLSLQRVRRKPIDPKIDGKRTPMINASSPSISWPSTLCFCKAFSMLNVNSKQIESTPALDTSYDPLSAAKAWFLGTGERDDLLARKKKERELAASQEPSSSENQMQNTHGLSPLALHRAAQPGAPPGAMYPTPPDGVQNIVGVTPSMDGTVSSPGVNAATTVMVDIDTAMATENFNDGWAHQEPKQERVGSSFGSENLFGDLGPDMFGDNDITDADFNFFDEQPTGMDLSLGVSDMSNADGLLDISPTLRSPPAPEIKQEHSEPQPPAVPPAPIFAKPELKHARSSLTDELKKPSESDTTRHRGGAPAKRQASPFTPDEVFKRIRASLDNRKAFQSNSGVHAQMGSIFDKVEFDPGLSKVNSKYQGNGRFGFSADRLQEMKAFIFNAPPTTSYLQRRGRGRKSLKNPPANVGELFARMANGQESASQHGSPVKLDDPPSDADDLSLISDEDDSSYESDEPSSPPKAGSVRRRRGDDDGESLATSFRELEFPDLISPHLSLDLPRFSKSEVELPLSKYFADPEPYSSQLSIPDHDFVVAAQILTEQLCTSTLSLVAESKFTLQSKLDRRRDLLALTNRSLQELRAVLPAWLGQATECLFRPFLDVQDVPLLGQPTRMQLRPPGIEQYKPSNLFQIQSPHLEVRRYESRLSVLPSAVTFWESLGLGPSQGQKDINAICIHPDFEGVSDSVNGFLDKMQSVYESLKLGSFSRMSASPDIPGGLLPFQVEADSEAIHGTASILHTSLLNGLSKLSDVLAHLTARETNFVVYFVYPAGLPGALIESCYAFHQLFERYKKLLVNSRKPVDNDIVLQLIPMDFVATSTSIATPSPTDYIKLGLETYDRCTIFGGVMPAPALVLEQNPPRIIDFKLSATPSASLLHENTCLHIAYAQSIDERWITAAWTDNRGTQQMTASYCLGRKGKSLATSFGEVAHEIWLTTRDIISTWKVHWRIIITKCGIMDQAEIDLWASFAQTETKATVSLILMTVDTDPALQLIPPVAKIPVNASTNFYTTPVSTPQPSIVSPEQSGNPPTPSLRNESNNPTSAPTPGSIEQESEADATLTDITDHTWGAVLSHRLNNSTSLTDLNPAIVSGYLVKRGGPRAEDPPAVMEVNVVHSEGNPRAYESLLREMLTYFRGLGTLARARGIVDRENDVRPWHIAAAEKGVRGLYLLM